MREAGDRRDAIGAEADTGKERFEEPLRPRNLREMVGQDRLRENLGVFIRAACERREPIDHLLFHGPPGLGKTSLAHIVAHEMSAPLRITSGPAIEKPGDLAALLAKLAAGAVLFLDPSITVSCVAWCGGHHPRGEARGGAPVAFVPGDRVVTL